MLRLIQYADTGRNLVATHPTGQDRLAFQLGVRFQLLGGLRRIGHRLRREDHQQAIAVRIFGGDLDGLGITFGAGIAEHVDGVVVAPGGGENLIQGFEDFRRNFGQFAAVGDQRIGGQDAGTSGVGQDGQTRTLGAGLLGEHFRHIEQVGDAVDAQHAATAESGFQHFVAAGERAGMGGGGLGGGFAAPGFNHDDGLVEGDFAGSGEEPRASPMVSM